MVPSRPRTSENCYKMNHYEPQLVLFFTLLVLLNIKYYTKFSVTFLLEKVGALLVLLIIITG